MSRASPTSRSGSGLNSNARRSSRASLSPQCPTLRVMRRPPIACRRVVHSLQNPPSAQHVWISDDLLAVAFNRFFPSSCPQQKRHGSHTPGPLEARRRAAKRRMTVSAGFCPQHPFPSTFNWRAWFGLRKKSQPAWTYEAPSLQRNPPDPLDPSMFAQ